MVIEIEKGKNYAVRFYYKDCFGRQQRPYKSGFPTRKAAELWELQEKARLNGEKVSSEKITFAQLRKLWRESLVIKNVSPKTLEKYDRYLSYISEYIDHLHITKITETMCQKLIGMHLDSPATCVEIRKVMSAAFNYARRKRWMRENPFDFVDMPKYSPKKYDAYNFDDIKELFNLLKEENSKLYTPTLCACLFAATREEVCALQESDITRLKDGKYKLTLDRALISVNGRTILKDQKTENRRRTFIFSQEIYDELHYFKDISGIQSFFVCCNKNGSNIQPNTISNSFSRFLSEHKLKYTTFHKLRDAFANSCKRLKIDLDTTFRMMGHSSYKVTAEHYATADDFLTAEAVGKIEKALLN